MAGASYIPSSTSLDPQSAASGQITACTVTVSPPLPNQQAVQITCSHPDVCTVITPQVTGQAGTQTLAFSISAAQVLSPVDVTLTVSGKGWQSQVTLTVGGAAGAPGSSLSTDASPP